MQQKCNRNATISCNRNVTEIQLYRNKNLDCILIAFQLHHCNRCVIKMQSKCYAIKVQSKCNDYAIVN